MGRTHFRPAAIGLFALEVLHQNANKKDPSRNDLCEGLVPYLETTADNRVNKLEKFGDYVGRQLGFQENSTPQFLSKLANGYVKANKNCFENNENIFTDLTGILSRSELDSFCTELMRELEACIVSYFSFHWDYSFDIVDEVLQRSPHPKTKLRGVVRTAARKHRLERAVRTLKTKNVFSTLVEQLKAINISSSSSDKTAVRSPVLLLVGGGMGAGKSSVVKEILKCPFWQSAAKNAVIVEADAFKETDLIYQALSSDGYKEMLETAELVHKSSTDAASSLLVAALNEGRDVIFDGTMSWKPFVLQTIAMVRDVHNRRYRMGPGYQLGDDGHVHEKYWEPIEERDSKSGGQKRLPYRIELIGVTCDPSLAVVRGVRRAIQTGRAVDIRKQLMSHKMFADGFLHYCELVDQVKLYSTNKLNNTAELMGVKELNNTLLVNPEGVKTLRKLSVLNPNAQSVIELYNKQNDLDDSHHGWKDVVLCPQRCSQQKSLQTKIKRIEALLREKSTEFSL